MNLARLHQNHLRAYVLCPLLIKISQYLFNSHHFKLIRQLGVSLDVFIQFRDLLGPCFMATCCCKFYGQTQLLFEGWCVHCIGWLVHGFNFLYRGQLVINEAGRNISQEVV